jgi:hypothetical protein
MDVVAMGRGSYQMAMVPHVEGRRVVTRPTISRRRVRALVVVEAVVVLVAVAALVVNHVETADLGSACQNEYRYVQAGLDAYMASNNLVSLPVSRGTYDMTTPVALYVRDARADTPSYVPSSQTTWSYAWDQMGRITAIMARPGGPAIPPACLIPPS